MDRGGGDEMFAPHSPDENETLVLDPRTEGQVPPVRPAAPVPSPSGTAGRGGRSGRRGGDSNDSDVGGEDAGLLAGPEDYTKENLPPVADHEVEVTVPDALSYTAGQSTRSKSKIVGNFRFRILVFPSGTHSTGGQQVSAFVEAEPIEGLDPRWVFNGVKYQVAVVNWLDYRRSVAKMDTWTFSKDGIDRGWHDMVRTQDLSPETGWLGPDNSICVRASCYVRQADGINVNSDYNFRRETGYIGLMNHGATCYMNGLLQSLFHVGDFRRIVYSIENEDIPDSPGKGDEIGRSKGDDIDIGRSKKGDDDGDNDGKAPPLIQALQNVFYRLQTADAAVNCRELMKSFGWDTMDAFTQHDAQELNRILCDRLEEQMKGSPMDGSIKRLFEGEMENYIECMDVDYRSRRNETFYDIQLNIKGERQQDLRNIEESLREFTAEETLEGDNAYEAEGHGKQRAKKGIRFLTFPPVLNLQLKRFHFDLEKMDMVKLNSKFEFHRRLDLSAFAPGAGTYLLHAVVVHSGDVNSGHYYAHIRPTLDNGWFKFDDDTVTPSSEFAAVEDNYGGSDLGVWNYFDRTPRELRSAQCPTRPRIHNAYMLVYIREDCVAEVLRTPDPMRINQRMVERCCHEVRLAEQRRREKMEQQLKIRIRIVFDRDLCKMTGFWDHAEIPHGQTLKMGRDQVVKELAQEAESLTEVSSKYLAFFSLHYRNNPRQVRFAFMPPSSTLRSHIPQFTAPHFDTSDPYLTVLCIAARGYDAQTFKWRPDKALETKKPEEICKWHDETVTLLIVKYFCPVSRKIVTLGCIYIPNVDPLISMVQDGWVTERLKSYIISKEVSPLPEDPESYTWECWEEFSERDIQPRNVKRAVKTEQLWSGDLIIWQPQAKRGAGDAPVGDSGATGEAPVTSAQGEGGVGEPAPTYPVNNVSDLAAHLSNSIDVVVTLHDSHQPLCVDGVIANGHWGPPRPASAAPKDSKKEAQPPKEETPEDIALSLSPAKFQTPREQELKMDLRWHLHHVTGTIARIFGVKGQPAPTANGAASGAPEPPQLWLFHAAPSSTCEDPLNAHPRGTEQTTLKELQRNATYISSPGKKPLNLHAVEVNFGAASPKALERGSYPFCIRFFDDAVREVGSTVIVLSERATVGDLVAEASGHLRPEWGIQTPLRALEVSDGRLQKPLGRSELVPGPDTPIRVLSCFNKPNIFYHSIRMETDTGPSTDTHRLVEIFHCDRQSQQAFGQPIFIHVAPGEKAGAVKQRCKEKLRVPDSEFKSWRLVRCGTRLGRTHLKDDESWDSDPSSDARLCLEHVHPNPTSSFARQSRYNKPLTIK